MKKVKKIIIAIAGGVAAVCLGGMGKSIYNKNQEVPFATLYGIEGPSGLEIGKRINSPFESGMISGTELKEMIQKIEKTNNEQQLPNEMDYIGPGEESIIDSNQYEVSVEYGENGDVERIIASEFMEIIEGVEENVE